MAVDRIARVMAANSMKRDVVTEVKLDGAALVKTDGAVEIPAATGEQTGVMTADQAAVVSKLNDRVSMTTITGTTDSYGYLYMPSLGATRYVLSASTPGAVVIPFIGSANYWQFKVMDGNLNAKTSTLVTITVISAKKEYLE